MPRPFTPALALAALVLLAHPGPAAAQAATTGQPSARYPMLAPCAETPGALCGTLTVPEDRSKPDGRKIALKVAVVPALGGAPVADPMFAITGGGPGVASLSDAAGWPKAFARLHERQDIVFVDQRGTGGSNPLDCPLGDEVAAAEALIGGGLPLKLIAECRDLLAKGADVSAYTTAAAADDLDDVRQWLKFERINLYGASYASRLALAYAQRHPAQVRTITVKALMPPSYRNPLFAAVDAQRSLDRIFRDCDADSACRTAFPNLAAQFDSVLTRLSREPAAVTLRSGAALTVTRDMFAGVIRRMLSSVEAQSAVPLAIASAARGDYSPLLPVLGAGALIDRVLNIGLFLSVTCAEDAAAFDAAAVKTAVAGTFTGPALAAPVLAACALWPAAKVGADFHEPVRAGVPALVISGALDAGTPPRWGIEMAKLLPGARIIEAEGVAHSGMPRCLAGLIESFVISGSAAGLDTACLAELRRPPFALPK